LEVLKSILKNNVDTSGNFLKVHETIETTAVKKNTLLKIYLWNNEKNEIFIDNFGVEILSSEN
jgi:hypothetical protein